MILIILYITTIMGIIIQNFKFNIIFFQDLFGN